MFLSELKGKKKREKEMAGERKNIKLKEEEEGKGGGERWEHRQTDRLGVQRIKCGR